MYNERKQDRHYYFVKKFCQYLYEWDNEVSKDEKLI